MMHRFREALAAVNPSPEDRTWVYVPYDQLNHGIGPLAELDASEAGVVLVETLAKPSRRPYHKQKLALVLANMRHFALEQARRGVAVDYRVGRADTLSQLRGAVQEHGKLLGMRPAERELRAVLAPLVKEHKLVWQEHDGWLTTPDDFREGAGTPDYRMDAFYRHVRKHYDVLMDGTGPVGGRYSFDGDNREPWRGEPEPPTPPRFEVDATTEEVGALFDGGPLSDHPGQLDLGALPVTAEDAQTWWAWAQKTCMTHFGPYEDAMTLSSRTLFHTHLSPLINLHRLLPTDVVQDALALDIPLNSKEGFVRQILGWREFVRHVHEVTDGFRVMPGDSGWTGERHELPTTGVDDGASARVLGGDMALPPVYWGDRPSGLNCLDHVVETVWDHAHSHHITRLMVLSNIARLLDVSPRQLTDWFWVAYDDAYDWVVEPNVLGMGTFGVGPIMTTKPYVSGSNYIHKMSDYCSECAFHPKKTCPITPMYWAFLARNGETLRDNQRMNRMYWSLDKRSEEKRRADARTVERLRAALAAGERLTPEDGD